MEMMIVKKESIILSKIVSTIKDILSRNNINIMLISEEDTYLHNNKTIIDIDFNKIDEIGITTIVPCNLRRLNLPVVINSKLSTIGFNNNGIYSDLYNIGKRERVLSNSDYISSTDADILTYKNTLNNNTLYKFYIGNIDFERDNIINNINYIAFIFAEEIAKLYGKFINRGDLNIHINQYSSYNKNIDSKLIGRIVNSNIRKISKEVIIDIDKDFNIKLSSGSWEKLDDIVLE